jgi:NagD protein
MREMIDQIKNKTGFVIDMDRILYHGNKLLPGVIEFVEWLKSEGKKNCNIT